MHRISNIAVNENNDNLEFIEQPPADFIFITSVKADIKILSELINRKDIGIARNNLRAIELSNLDYPAQIDNYISKTISYSKVVILRLFGDKNLWSYGIEQLRIWSNSNSDNLFIVLSGTEDNELLLSELSNIDFKISICLSNLLRAGGLENYIKFLKCLNFISRKNIDIPNNLINAKYYPDPYLYDWKNEKGISIGIISYKSLFLANEIELNSELIKILREHGYSPKTFFVSTLKNVDIHEKLLKFIKEQNIKLLITTTSFDSSLKKSDQIINLFEKIRLPILQILTSSRSKNEWLNSSIGMNSIDLLMQIVIPEFDGRITTRPCAFKEISSINDQLCSEITSYKIDDIGIKWVIKFINNYIKLSSLKNFDKKVTLVISNYPVKNGRIGNGVGLNTPDSVVMILHWLKREGYNLGNLDIPKKGSDLMSMLIQSRTNDPESINHKPLDYVSLKQYLISWNDLPEDSKNRIISRWGFPDKAIDIEKHGFPINGLIFGNVCLLIQPQRGYDQESSRDIHSPDLPPPHRYLAQYLWIENIFKSNVISHIGKHGTAEWLPGKSVGLSNNCFPDIICPALPNIYPFIVNDPGEGSQAKRRLQATIIDHLTPPLDRAELYGYLAKLEILLDEYYEAKLLSSDRTTNINNSIKALVKSEFEDLFDIDDPDLVTNIDSYLCEIKETQIRTGLHTFGKSLKQINEINLFLSISRVPTSRRLGLIQYISNKLNLELETWSYDYNQALSKHDIKTLNKLSGKQIINFRNALEFLEDQAKYLLYYYFYKGNNSILEIERLKNTNVLNVFILDFKKNDYFKNLKEEIYIPLINSYKKEKEAFISALNGNYIISGPSGAPTRGKVEVLPTGKNFFSLDTRGLPTETAWFAGNDSANKIIELYKQENGEDLNNIAISIWATSTMRNGGEDVCQILSLMGLKPLWDGPSRRVIDLDIIPLSILNRPRVDVTVRISGMFRDSFPQLINLLSKGVNLISNLEEDKKFNHLSFCSASGLNLNRIFGSAPGSYGAGLQELISNSSWDSEDDLAEAYINWSHWSYDNNIEPIYSRKTFEDCLKKIQLVVHNQDNREHDILDSDDYYQFQGGIACAIKKLSGKYPEIYNGDFSKFGHTKISKLSDEIDKVVRSRVLNPKWINGMMDNGYKGAFEFAATLDYLYAYDATTKLVTNFSYKSIYKSWLLDDNIINFFRSNNPWALRDIAQRFLEIINRKMWDTNNEEIINNLKKIINNTESEIEKNY